MIGWQDRLTGPAGRVVDRYFTDARGGVSRPPYAGLNLGAHVGDDPAAVADNRARLADEVGVPPERLVWMNQVHGAKVWVAERPGQTAPEGDGVLTATADLALAVLVADCTPVLLADVDAGVVGAVHAGRPGMVAGVVPAAVRRMRDLGAERIVAAVGPSVCGRCYEVPAEMRDAATDLAPGSRAVSWTGTPAIDVAAGVVEQLTTDGVAVSWVAGCTRESDHLYSYRRDQRTGRFAGVVVLRGEGAP